LQLRNRELRIIIRKSGLNLLDESEGRDFAAKEADPDDFRRED
jgi:hypothetical protein